MAQVCVYFHKLYVVRRAMRFHTTTSVASTLRRVTAAVAAVGLTLTVAACTINTGEGEESRGTADQVAQSEEAPKDTITANVEDGDDSTPVADMVDVNSDSKLTEVTLTNEAGGEVEGKKSKDGKKWTASEKLGYGRTYTLEAKDKDETFTAEFTTESPAGQTNAALSPLDGSTVGVGQSVSFQFDTAITDRKAVEDLISIKTTPHVEGAFYWISNQTLRWRPEEYWAPGTKVDVEGDFYGHDLGGGVYGEADRSASFTIGDALRAVVDDSDKTMTIYQNGEVIKTMPVSLGRDGGRWSTPNGVYQIGDQYDRLTMDSNTFGYSEAEGGYITDVDYATQMSYSGIYIHSAPWASWAFGNTNQSHGCINVSPADAKWVYENFKRGDIVEVKNTTGEQLDGHDGLGDWNIPWETWSAGNADQG